MDSLDPNYLDITTITIINIKMNYTIESIQGVITQLAELSDRITQTQYQRVDSLLATERMKGRIKAIEREIIQRQKTPENYPIGAGAGTIEDCKKEIDQLRKDIEEEDTFSSNLDQTFEDLQEDKDQYELIIKESYDLATLLEQRRNIGKEMSREFRLQKESYDLQKERYELCKRRLGFSREDRMFIDEHKQKVYEHKQNWINLCDQREILCNLIHVLDPEDQDPGFDEQEDIDVASMENQEY